MAILRKETILLWPLLFACGRIICTNSTSLGDGDSGDIYGGGDGEGDWGWGTGNGASWPVTGDRRRAANDFGYGFGNMTGGGNGRSC